VEIRSIQDFWRQRTKGWGEAARKRLDNGLGNSQLERHFARYLAFAKERNLDPLKAEQAIAALADYLEHYLQYDTKGRKRKKPLLRPQGTLVAICVAINAAFEGVSQPSPAAEPLIQRLVDNIVKQETKRAKKNKGIIDFPKLLRFILARPMEEEEKERTLLIVVIAAVRIARIDDLAKLDRRETKFPEGENSMHVIIESLGEKADRTRQGNASKLPRCSDPRVCPVRLLYNYTRRTERQAAEYARTLSKDRPVPLFFYLRGEATPLSSRALRGILQDTLDAAGMGEDSMGRAIKPGSFRISARDAAVRAGHPEPLISAVGHWAMDSVQAKHYTVYDVPDSWTDSILQPERIDAAS
jgi:hypothetical protein